MADHQQQQQQHDLSSLTNNNNPTSPLKKIIAVASIAAGIQFGWALQLSLLTPYVQLLGIPHKWAAFIWLCGPVSGMIVQPVVGYQSDRCLSKYGRRRPFIAAGSALVIIAVLCISFAADLGRRFGDPPGSSKSKPRAIIIFVIGFWILDVANNMLQGPCRAFLADLSGKSPRMTRKANACYSFFMAVGNVLGYAAGSITSLYKIVPFTKTEACDIYCANLKACFFISVVLLIILTTIVLTTVHDEAIIPSVLIVASNNNGGNGHDHEITRDLSSSSGVESGGDVRRALMNLKKPMWMLLLVTCLNWVAWFPFLLFDTDWMGKEVYGGKVGEGSLYGIGVREGALGLMLNSIVLGFMSLWVELLGRKMGGVKRLWGCVNFILAVCLGLTVLISKLAESSRSGGGGEEVLPPVGIKVSALALFAVLGIPLAVTYSIPFALASIFSNSSGAGQGLSLGVLNLAIVLPQILVSMASGPWDALFGGGNTPAFVVGAVAAVASAILALTMLPSPPPDHIPSTTTRSTALKTYSSSSS